MASRPLCDSFHRYHASSIQQPGTVSVTSASRIGKQTRDRGAAQGDPNYAPHRSPLKAKRRRNFGEGGTHRVRTVLGLSKTSTSIGWVLVDGRDVAGDPLDHDAFDITDSSAPAPAATARRVRDIATATGYTVDSVHVTTSGNVSSLRDALTEAGFDDVVSVPLTEATRAWAVGAGRASNQEKTAVCVLGRDSASLSMIDTRSGEVHVATTTISGDSAGLTEWLNAALGNNGSRPECLYLIGSRVKLDALASHLDEALSIPVVATHDAQLALALGAASSNVKHVEHVIVSKRTGFASHARTLTVVAAVAIVSLFTLSSADSSIPLAQKSFQQPVPPPAAEFASIPTKDAPVAPMVLPPPPKPAVAQPVTQEAPPRWIPAPVAVAPDVVVPATVPVAVPETVDAAPRVEHLPEVQPVQHIPDAQSAAVLGPAPVAPGPAAPAPPSSTPDPVVGVLNPLFSSLP